jgi:hypothetical protein
METTQRTETSGQTRRRLLGRLGLVLGGVAGAVGYAAAGASARRDLGLAVTTPTPKATQQVSLVVRGQDWRLHGLGRTPGQIPGKGDMPAPLGRLVDGRGRPAGSFRAAPMPGPAAMFQLHTFELTDGSLLGVGGGPLSEAVYAVVGGTGRWAGASGSYVARQFPREAGGDGTAEFSFTLTVQEA